MPNLIISKKERREISNVLHRFEKDKSQEEIFYDLCFTLMVPAASFKGARKALEGLKSLDFYSKDVSHEELIKWTRFVRFKNEKARRLLTAKERMNKVFALVESKDRFEETYIRAVLSNAIPGMGYKAASHFLRNQGFTDLAILDVHILRFLEHPTTICKSKTEYLLLEERFRGIAKAHGISVAGLDALIWKKASGTSYEDFIY